ncbi:MAG: hypothetical protein AAB895_01395 [Patescibacteria group bacterium]
MTDFIQKYYSALFIGLLLVTVGVSFYLGYEQGTLKKGESGIVFSCPDAVLSRQQIPLTSSVELYSPDDVVAVEPSISNSAQSTGAYMGSKNGTKYYTPGCPGSKRIKPENYVWFQSVQDATLQGYTKGSC